MSSGSAPPEDVMDSVRLIQHLKGKLYLSREERTDLNRAKLHVAYWACRSENIVASRDNLAYILGPDAAEIMGSFDKYLITEKEKEEREKEERKKKQAKKDGGEFWGDA